MVVGVLAFTLKPDKLIEVCPITKTCRFHFPLKDLRRETRQDLALPSYLPGVWSACAFLAPEKSPHFTNANSTLFWWVVDGWNDDWPGGRSGWLGCGGQGKANVFDVFGFHCRCDTLTRKGTGMFFCSCYKRDKERPVMFCEAASLNLGTPSLQAIPVRRTPPPRRWRAGGEGHPGPGPTRSQPP